MITQAIMDRLAGIDGKIGISYIDLEEEKELFFGNSRVFQGSGAIMLMALVECFKQIENEELVAARKRLDLQEDAHTPRKPHFDPQFAANLLHPFFTQYNLK